MTDQDLVQTMFNGLSAYQNGRLTEAIELLSKALEIKHDEWEARLYLGMSYYRTGLRKQARYQFQTIMDWCQNQEIRKMAKVALEAVNLEMNNPQQSDKGSSGYHEM